MRTEHKNLKIVFCGTPEYATPYFEGLIAHGLTPILVITQPDRHVGRKKIVSPPPMKRAACAAAIDTWQPERINTPEGMHRLRVLHPDLCVVVAFGQIISPELLSVPRFGWINVHPSLLPLYRGASPLQEAILNGDTHTGVTIMRMDALMDHGDILAQRSIPIASDETLKTLEAKTIQQGVPLLIETIRHIARGTAHNQPQDHARATYTRMLTKDTGMLIWNEPAIVLERRIRALQKWPGTWTVHRKKRIKILRATVVRDVKEKHSFGEWWASPDKQSLFVACNPGVLALHELQPEGGHILSAQEFIRGYSQVLFQ